jgi:pimeloyl-ACP methyl ester carboxylesterase
MNPFVSPDGQHSFIGQHTPQAGQAFNPSARASAAIVKGAELIIYAGAPHGLTDTHKDRLNQDLLTFLRK